jgi:hypothetical protein
MTSLLLKLTPTGDKKLQAIIEEYTFERELDVTAIDKAEVVEAMLDGLSDKQMFGEAPIEIMGIPFIMGEDITFIKGGNVTWI